MATVIGFFAFVAVAIIAAAVALSRQGSNEAMRRLKRAEYKPMSWHIWYH